MKRWIAFDAAGTLFEPAEPVENIYADCFSNFGFSLPKEKWKTAFKRAFEITSDPDYSGNIAGETVEKNWWRDIVHNSTEATGIRPDPDTMAAAFEELFDHYAAGSAWKLFPETAAILTSLKSESIGLAVTSNFDMRLHRVLTELGISSHFDFVLTSADAGARKPSPLILNKFMEQAETATEDCCMVGDSLFTDGGAAKAAGIGFYCLDRPSRTLDEFARWFRNR